MAEAAGTDVPFVALADLDRVACNRDFCRWQQMGLVILAQRGRDRIEGAAMAPACAAADVVISERWLPRECVARWVTIDRDTLAASAGVAPYLGAPPLAVAPRSQGDARQGRGPPHVRGNEEKDANTAPAR